jgi:hypothetical protein
MLQRGRRSRGSREFLTLIGHTPQPRDLPPPPAHFDEAKRKTWSTLVRENRHLNHCGCTLLECAISALFRARFCAKIIKEDGGTLIIGKDHRPRRHPLASLEVQNRKLVRDIFKMLKIEVREVE